MASQGASHPAQLLIGLPGEALALWVPPLPQHARGELEQGKGGLLLARGLDHLGHQAVVFVSVAQGLHRPGQDLAQLVRLGGADQGHPAQGRAHRGAACHPAQEILPQGEDHPVRAQGVVGCPAHGLHEGPPPLGIRAQSVQLLQLVHEEQHPAAQPGSQPLQDEGEVGGVGAQQLMNRGRRRAVRAHAGQGLAAGPHLR